MHIFFLIGSIGLAGSIMLLGATSNSNTQTLSVSSTKTVVFERGKYEIVKSEITAKTTLSEKEIEKILIQAGFAENNLAMAKAIVFYESTNRPMAFNKASNCYGLFQINMSGSMGPDRRKRYGLESNKDLFDPIINAKVAYKMSDGGNNWSAWTTKNLAKKNINKFLD